ncbi:site-specific integrase [Hymenobacter volaticus]|uniref:Site-specific integrase n=1 Tax=Hymenobacter volaticus TaxID=2932254 RepID=A0ABY4G7I1_9BACT|nr:phage integrase SAM-like domain-containing protein [Hymenobacter volaticus]UOQ66797.1 site-specific integrase [Hymenobacter volaticus]
MHYSAAIKLRRPARQDGTCQILLQVVIRRKPHPLGLGIAWWPELFDEKKGLCLTFQPKKGRLPGYEQVLSTAIAWAGGTIEYLEEKAKDTNLIIGKARSKANDVFVNLRLTEQPVTSETFLLDYNTEASKKDFVAYMEAKISERFRKGKGHREGITDITRKNHTSTLNCLRKFRTSIPFYSINAKLVDDFHAYLLKHLKGINTRWGRHKDIKAYLALARKDRVRFEDPYVHFKNKSVEGNWKPLKPAELHKLKVYYTQLPVGSARRRILQRFLFSCCSSLRLGDLKNLHAAKLQG